MEQYFKYDSNRKEYYIDQEGALNLLPFEPAELEEELKKVDYELKRMSQLVYNTIYKMNFTRNRAWIHYKIHRNEENERQAIFDAILETVRQDMLEGTSMHGEIPPIAVEYLRTARLLHLGDFYGEIPEYE